MLDLVIAAGSGISSAEEPGSWASGGLVFGVLVVSTWAIVRLVSWLDARIEVKHFISELESWETGTTKPASLTQTESVRVTASDDAREVIRNSGGMLFVWPIGFTIRTLKASCDPPRRALEFRRLTAGGFLLFLHPALRRLPKQLNHRDAWAPSPSHRRLLGRSLSTFGVESRGRRADEASGDPMPCGSSRKAGRGSAAHTRLTRKGRLRPGGESHMATHEVRRDGPYLQLFAAACQSLCRQRAHRVTRSGAPSQSNVRSRFKASATDRRRWIRSSRALLRA